MPAELVYFQADDETVPMVEWLEELPAKALQKCLARLERLEQLATQVSDDRKPIISAMTFTS